MNPDTHFNAGLVAGMVTAFAINLCLALFMLALGMARKEEGNTRLICILNEARESRDNWMAIARGLYDSLHAKVNESVTYDHTEHHAREKVHSGAKKALARYHEYANLDSTTE